MRFTDLSFCCGDGSVLPAVFLFLSSSVKLTELARRTGTKRLQLTLYCVPRAGPVLDLHSD